MARIRFKRGTTTQLLDAAAAEQLAAGEPYLLTDREQLAVGTGAGSYALVASQSEIDDQVTLDAAVEFDGEVWLDWRTGRRVRAAYVAAAGNAEIALFDPDLNTTFFGTLLLQVGAGATVSIYNPHWIGMETPDFSDAGFYIVLFRGFRVGGATHIIADAGRYL